MDSICIIIPCYNEEKRLPLNEFSQFLSKNSSIHICFVNDGSSDNTLAILTNAAKLLPHQIFVVNLPKNLGKAAAVRQGMLSVSGSKKYDIIGYFDADLATPLDEIFHLIAELERTKTDVAFGSRVCRVGATIKRKKLRHYSGRIIATIISNILQLPIYDSQCGAKLFKASLIPDLFNEQFASKWLFDVEIFARLLLHFPLKNPEQIMIEVPLNKWIDVQESKVKTSYLFKLFIDLYTIYKKYTKQIKNRKVSN